MSNWEVLQISHGIDKCSEKYVKQISNIQRLPCMDKLSKTIEQLFFKDNTIPGFFFQGFSSQKWLYYWPNSHETYNMLILKIFTMIEDELILIITE